MESSRLREHGSRLPMSWDRGGTTTARGRRCPGWGMQTAGGRAPAGGWGGRPCRLNGVNVFPSRLEEADTACLPAPRGTRPGPSLTTCLVERVAGPRPSEPKAPPSRTTALPTRSRENREISRHKPTSISRVSPRTNMAVQKNQKHGTLKVLH